VKLDDKTTIPLVFALGSLPFIVGAILWLASIDAKATKGAESADIILEIRDRVIRIETIMGSRK